MVNIPIALLTIMDVMALMALINVMVVMAAIVTMSGNARMLVLAMIEATSVFFAIIMF